MKSAALSCSTTRLLIPQAQACDALDRAHHFVLRQRRPATHCVPAQQKIERDKRIEAKLKRQAQQRGYRLVPIEEKPAA